jgi:hypothetical protein
LVSKILVGYEEALWPSKLEISHGSHKFWQTIVRFWFFLSYLITTYAICFSDQNLNWRKGELGDPFGIYSSGHSFFLEKADDIKIFQELRHIFFEKVDGFSLFLIAILHRVLRNWFFSVHLLSYSIWTFISLFYWDFFIWTFLFQSFFQFFFYLFQLFFNFFNFFFFYSIEVTFWISSKFLIYSFSLEFCKGVNNPSVTDKNFWLPSLKNFFIARV